MYAMAKASDVKFVTLLGFAKADHKITPGRKIKRSPGLRKLNRASVMVKVQ